TRLVNRAWPVLLGRDPAQRRRKSLPPKRPLRSPARLGACAGVVEAEGPAGTSVVVAGAASGLPGPPRVGSGSASRGSLPRGSAAAEGSPGGFAAGGRSVAGGRPGRSPLAG